jgi:hypothetical protein
MVALSLMAHVASAEDVSAGKPQKKFKGPVKVFILAGQSNMEGQGSVDHDGNEGKGNLVWSMKHSKSAEKMKKLKNEKGEWVVRDDVLEKGKVLELKYRILIHGGAVDRALLGNEWKRYADVR